MNAPDGRLCEQVAIVTGGAGGIGRATCRALAQAGAQVLVADVNPVRLAETIESLETVAARPPVAVAVDLRNEADADGLAREALTRWGRIDILVNAAGVLRGPGQTPRAVADLSLAEWTLILETNLRAVFLSCRAVLPTMLRQRRGDIVNLSSTSGRQGIAFDAAYCASKFGVIGFSEALADEVRTHGVRVQAVLPGAVDTPLWQQNGPLFRPRDIMAPERVANLIAFLVGLPDDVWLQHAMLLPLGSRHRVEGTGGSK